MNNRHMPITRPAVARPRFLTLDNDAKVKLGVGATIGSCLVTMLLMIPA